MRSTFMGMNIIGETHDIFMVTCCVLHGYLNCNIIHLTVCIDWCIKDYILVLVDIFNVTSNPTFIMIMLGLFQTLALISDRNLKTAI
ncbi:Uncharacterised protein [Streptococcus pneumoniae]|nr:Uncharacterised protein [Streptococcus pneumoniae]CAG5363679.1 Uncharacterised protein [Streptococcus pneumoniae]CKV14098.1 Uncharacterised protein [Mycobacterium tuberculosis]CKV87721.1 Uncharacterised protein [Mycobacterium tuberculosis]